MRTLRSTTRRVISATRGPRVSTTLARATKGGTYRVCIMKNKPARGSPSLTRPHIIHHLKPRQQVVHYVCRSANGTQGPQRPTRPRLIHRTMRVAPRNHRPLPMDSASPWQPYSSTLNCVRTHFRRAELPPSVDGQTPPLPAVVVRRVGVRHGRGYAGSSVVTRSAQKSHYREQSATRSRGNIWIRLTMVLSAPLVFYLAAPTSLTNGSRIRSASCSAIVRHQKTYRRPVDHCTGGAVKL